MDFSLLTFGELLHPLNVYLKNKIRNFEKHKKQILSAKYGILFNQTCLNEELQPTYTNIYIYTHTHCRSLTKADCLYIHVLLVTIFVKLLDGNQ